MINIYLNLGNCVFLIKDYDIKIFLLLIFINVIISRLLFDMMILSFNNKD